ncbi:hypothetical protein AB0G35_35990 [Streptomyces sp. NPDC021749]|uniref:hypothetical protein n=1 Tax=Streptomyces sp. NPDC021749 TaxID=3154905 RepID=UPI003407000D
MLFPMFVAAVRRTPHTPRWRLAPQGPEPQRRRALVGQLLLIITGAGLFVGGAVISVVGLTGVFVSTDLAFLGTSTQMLETVSPRLVPFVAHDRAGFGGALMAAAVAIALLSAWAGGRVALLGVLDLGRGGRRRFPAGCRRARRDPLHGLHPPRAGLRRHRHDRHRTAARAPYLCAKTSARPKD